MGYNPQDSGGGAQVQFLKSTGDYDMHMGLRTSGGIKR